MSDDYRDVYSAPEKFGLTIVYEEEVGGAYEFDKFVVWSNGDATQPTFFYAMDAGCSCPTPFEGLQPDDLFETDEAGIVDALRAWADYRRGYVPPGTLDSQPLQAALARAGGAS